MFHKLDVEDDRVDALFDVDQTLEVDEDQLVDAVVLVVGCGGGENEDD